MLIRVSLAVFILKSYKIELTTNKLWSNKYLQCINKFLF